MSSEPFDLDMLLGALSELCVSLRQTAIEYGALTDQVSESASDGAGEATGQATPGAALLERFTALAREHDAEAEALESYLREAGELPKEPDPDRLELELLVTRLTAWVEGEDLAVLLGACLAWEEGLAESAEAALGLAPVAEVPVTLRETLAGLEGRARTTARWARQELAELEG